MNERLRTFTIAAVLICFVLYLLPEHSTKPERPTEPAFESEPDLVATAVTEKEPTEEPESFTTPVAIFDSIEENPMTPRIKKEKQKPKEPPVEIKSEPESKPLPPAGTVTIQTLKKVFGTGCPVQWVKLKFDESLPVLTKCYEDSLRVNPELSGELGLRVILQQGEVGSARTMGPNVAGSEGELEECVLSVIRQWHFRGSCSMEWNATIDFIIDP